MLAGWWNTHKFTFMSALPRYSYCNLVPFCYQIFNGGLKVRKSCAEGSKYLFDAHVWWNTWYMLDVVTIKYPVYKRKISCAPEILQFLSIATGDGLVLLG
jgi:hypothetical protein